MGRLQNIEKALTQIEGGRFQSLCDSLLTLKNENYALISRTGSQTGTQKAVKGTPDSFFLLSNGKYVYVEHSTDVSSGVTKIKKDIEHKCLNKEKTGIPVSHISEIIITTNFKLKLEEMKELKSIVNAKRVKLTLETLDSISHDLHQHYRNLASEYLDIPFDTGQVVSIEQFIEEYNKKSASIATPLDTPYVKRDLKQQELIQAIESSDFVIVNGAPGVGKTKLCLETIRSYLNENVSYKAFCISYKHCDLLEDLHQYFDKNEDYLLFVDDANRMDSFNQITGFYQSGRKGKLKIITTVRDYAFNEIARLIFDFKPNVVEVGKLSKDQIFTIISSEPFKILNPSYQDPILRIANGNPRLAIMAAILGKEEQDHRVYMDVSELFENYFTTFVNDNQEFSNEFNIKCLGIIAFFNVIPYRNGEISAPLLESFDIDYYQFVDAIEKLEKLELVEIQYEYVKIPEQNLNTYFFYRAFIKDRLLSFEILLRYFQTNEKQFRDSVIPANNSFGSQNVMEVVQPFLRGYWEEIKYDWDLAYRFLSCFSLYMQNEVLEFVFNEIKNLPAPEISDYKVKYEQNDFSYNRNLIFRLIAPFLNHLKTMPDATELMFEYVRKKPENLPELIHDLREIFSFDHDDLYRGIERHFKFLMYLLKGFEKDDVLLVRSFYPLAESFLSFRFHHTKAVDGNSFQMYEVFLPNHPRIHEFRRLIWETIEKNFAKYPDWSLITLESYARMHPDVDKEIMEKDVAHVVKIMANHLTPESFEHCKYVQKQIRWCKRNGVSHESFDDFLEAFTNPIYELKTILEMDRFNDKEMFEFSDYREYEKLKEEQIRTSIKLKSEDQIEKFYNDFKYLYDLTDNKTPYRNSFSFVLDQVMKENLELGYFFLNLIISRNNDIEIVPRVLFINILNDEVHVKRFFELVKKSDFKNHVEWKLLYLRYLGDAFLTDECIPFLLQSLDSIEDYHRIYFDEFERYLKIDRNLFIKMIKLIYSKNSDQKTRIHIDNDLFEKYLQYTESEFDLVLKLYIQQRRIQHHFDFNFEGMKRILERNPDFILDYIQGIFIEEKEVFIEDHGGLGFVWSLPNYEDIVLRTFVLVEEKVTWYDFMEHYCNTFFRNVEEQYNDRANQFIIDYIVQNYSDSKKIAAIINIVTNSKKDMLESSMITYLRHNQNLEDFFSISWIKTTTVYSGDVNIGDIRAAEWREILSLVESTDLGIKTLPIRTKLNEMIELELRSAQEEKRERFLRRE
ncbi:MAG: ATP-binding protein [Flavobacteriales bacterium]|nr:ATP-binding protein [Flavobacteriales bacterium]